MPMMKAAYGRAGAGIGGITIRDVAIPAPGPGEALVRPTAATLNFRDLLCAVGRLEGESSWGVDVGRPVVRVVVGNREQHEAMLAFCARHRIRPVVDVVFDLERLPEALRLMERSFFFGNIGINLL